MGGSYEQYPGWEKALRSERETIGSHGRFAAECGWAAAD